MKDPAHVLRPLKPSGRLAAAPPDAAAGSAWPSHIGVGGIGVHRARTAPSDRASGRVAARLAEWAGALADSARRVPVESFPYREIVDHYRCHGRNFAHPELVAGLRAVHDRLPAPESVAERLLADWLPSTFDQDDGNYDSYLAMPMLERLAAAAGPAADTDARLDTEIAALLADLTLAEGTALAADADAHWQRLRTHATVQALARIGELAPQAHGVAAGPRTWRPVDRNDARLADHAVGLAQTTLDGVPATIRHAAEISMLPTTPLHDEIMFIRCVQLFELIFRQVFRCLERAIAALRGDDDGDLDVTTALGELGDAVRRIEGTPILYRVLTTMSRPAFAIIRHHTNGRSAIQSRAYRQVERISAPRPPGPADEKTARVDVPGPTLQEVFVALAAAADADPVRAVAAEMARLDQGWRAMKRTHWGITRKIIGAVQGTGGTAGADYLKTTAEMPLFPLLHEQDWKQAALMEAS
jgi:tryptophan 2,3-dioxygenase